MAKTKKLKKEDDINTPVGMLRLLAVKNQHGMWFVEINSMYVPLPRWMWGHLNRAVPNPRIIGVTE